MIKAVVNSVKWYIKELKAVETIPDILYLCSCIKGVYYTELEKERRE